MNLRDTAALQRLVEMIMDIVVARKWDRMEALSRGQRLSAAELEQIASEGSLVPISPPPNWQADVLVIPILVSSRPSFAVTLPFWEDGKGKSDYSIELTVVDPGGPDEAVEIDNFHVM